MVGQRDKVIRCLALEFQPVRRQRDLVAPAVDESVLTLLTSAGGEGVSAAKHFDRTILQLRDRSLTDLEGGL